MSIERAPIIPPALQALPKADPVEVDDTILAVDLKRSIPKRRSKKVKAGWLAGTFLVAGTIGGAELNWAMDNKGTIANMSRELVGFENTQWIEQQYLAFDDYKTRKLYQFGLGPDEKPFETPTEFISNEPPVQVVPEEIQLVPSSMSTGQNWLEEQTILSLLDKEPPKPKPFLAPQTRILLSNPLPGEGSWSIDGLPTTKEDLVMAKTFIRPDSARPYSSVGVIVFDSRRINLNMVGGATDRRNGGDKGPGKVPAQDLSNLLVVMNGGFQFDHARQNFNTSAPFVWGAYLDGVEYATLQPGMGSVAVFKDGTIKIGVWGEGELAQRTEDMVSVRQNGKLMIQDGQLTPAIQNEGDVFIWGKLDANSKGTVITTRSAIGMDKEGHLMIATANNMSALSLARGLQAAGADTAMQLDINSGWVQLGLVTSHRNDGTPILSSFMDGVGNGNKFLSSPQARDFLYITRSDDSRFIP